MTQEVWSAEAGTEIYHAFNWVGLVFYWIDKFGQVPSEFRLSYNSASSTDTVLIAEGSSLTYDVDGVPTGGTITSFRAEDEFGNQLFSVTGFTGVNATTFFTAATDDNTFTPGGRYQYLVSLLDDVTTVTGSTLGESIEVGAGNDTVTADDGNDVVFKWKAGSLDYNGGDGSDTISFNTATGSAYPTTKTTQLVVNLSDAVGPNGVNPYGGSDLTLTSVENIIGTDAAAGDMLTGNDQANVFGDGIYDIGADTINALGGNDRVELAEGLVTNHGGVHADGGTGIDTLGINMGIGQIAGPHRLDLANQASNTGVFEDNVLINFEVFARGVGFFGASGQTFTFLDTNDNAGRTVWGLGQTSSLTMKGGNDRVVLLNAGVPANYAVTANGGTGNDTLQFEVKFLSPAPTNVLDLLHPGQNTGTFAGSTFTAFETFQHVELDGGNTATQRFTFRGDGNPQTVIGALGIDNISTLGGNDTLKGGIGNDILNGGTGRDLLFGGADADRFVYGSKTHSVVGANCDQIRDFQRGIDDIDLRPIDANGPLPGNGPFKWIGGQAFHHVARELHFRDAGPHVLVEGDIDGNGAADFQILVLNVAALAMGDFLL